MEASVYSSSPGKIDKDPAIGDGKSVQVSINTNDMYSLAIEGKELGKLKAIWTKIEFRDPLPYLNSHLCVTYGKDCILLIGGDAVTKEVPENEDSCSNQEDFSFVVNNVYRLNMRTGRATLLPQENQEFKPRMAHSGVIYRDKIYIFGGLEKKAIFNNQFLKMSIKRMGSSADKDESPAVRSESRSYIPHCKFCPSRHTASLQPQNSIHLTRRLWPDLSALENKIKRRLVYFAITQICLLPRKLPDRECPALPSEHHLHLSAVGASRPATRDRDPLPDHRVLYCALLRRT